MRFRGEGSFSSSSFWFRRCALWLVREILLLPVLDYTKRDAGLSAEELEADRRGRPIRRTDAMMASIALNKRTALYAFDLRCIQPLTALGLKLFPPVELSQNREKMTFLFYVS